MNQKDSLPWLLSGDASIVFQTKRDLLGEFSKSDQSRIATTGWGKKFLEKQNPDSSWGRAFYQPKWISTHYTLLDLKQLCLPPENTQAQRAVNHILATEKRPDGGLGPGKTVPNSDTCVAGMFLNYACYFRAAPDALRAIVDFLLEQTLDDGGFNCDHPRYSVHHSSVHTTLSVLEGIESYRANDYRYRLEELLAAAENAREFLLQHQLFKSDKTGETIHPAFLKCVFPARWKYNIFRALDYFQSANMPYDDRLGAALDVVSLKMAKNGRWRCNSPHAGKTHFIMEATRAPSRWATLISLRILNFYRPT